MNNIHFFSEDLNYRLRNIKRIRQWILHTIEKEGEELDTINYIFTTDQYLHKINVDYLNHDTLTDIITFEYNADDEAILSDIYISLDRCKENAKELNIPLTTEIHRILIHGVLHLLGYKDKNKKDKELMTSKEDYYLSLRSEFGI
ncbi:MAG: rRNA maturation RNase YbeY [Bacteroidetes bacterium]|nr:MAG: rRNA maturation RNase YbeY [Bacteroidota bacterium]